MTCIVGIEHKGVIYMGGDSAGTCSDMTQRIRADQKIFIKDDFIFGFTGSFRTGQLLRCSLNIPEQPSDKDDYAYLVSDFVDAVKECLSKETDENAKQPHFLFGYNGKLYGIQGDYQVSRPEDGVDAAGSGGDIAMGSLYASKGKRPRKRIALALEAAALNNAAVRPPFTVMCLKKK